MSRRRIWIERDVIDAVLLRNRRTAAVADDVSRVLDVNRQCFLLAHHNADFISKSNDVFGYARYHSTCAVLRLLFGSFRRLGRFRFGFVARVSRLDRQLRRAVDEAAVLLGELVQQSLTFLLPTQQTAPYSHVQSNNTSLFACHASISITLCTVAYR